MSTLRSRAPLQTLGVFPLHAESLGPHVDHEMGIQSGRRVILADLRASARTCDIAPIAAIVVLTKG